MVVGRCELRFLTGTVTDKAVTFESIERLDTINYPNQETEDSFTNRSGVVPSAFGALRGCRQTSVGRLLTGTAVAVNTIKNVVAKIQDNSSVVWVGVLAASLSRFSLSLYIESNNTMGAEQRLMFAGK